jgi:hypothetical protein
MEQQWSAQWMHVIWQKKIAVENPHRWGEIQRIRDDLKYEKSTMLVECSLKCFQILKGVIGLKKGTLEGGCPIQAIWVFSRSFRSLDSDRSLKNNVRRWQPSTISRTLGPVKDFV